MTNIEHLLARVTTNSGQAVAGLTIHNPFVG